MAEQVVERPVLDLLASMTADSLEASDLDTKTLMMARLAALVAVDAPAASYLLNLDVASEVGIGVEEMRGPHDGDRTDRRHRGPFRGPGGDPRARLRNRGRRARALPSRR